MPSYRSLNVGRSASLVLWACLCLLHLGATPSFERDVRPLLKRRCLGCHGEQPDLAGGLDLRLRRTVLAGGDSGAAVVPADPDASLLLQQVRSGDMPPGDARKLNPEEVQLLREWIVTGANVDQPEPERLPPPGEPFLLDTELNHWSLQPLVLSKTGDVAAVDVTDAHAADGTVRRGDHNQIDAFIAAKLSEKGLTFAPEADRRTLVRRLYYNLLGLPPSPDAVAEFLADDAPDAWERLVDRLLASPHYGERWARHWLDVVHYGETHGYDKDQPRRNAWPYRDYVSRAFNEDKPYGRFVEEQLAGDMLFPSTRDGIEALGFIAAGPWDQIGHKEVPEAKVDGQIARHLDRDDMVQNTLTTFCSVTVGCAQCHDHKFDPIPQADYYALQAVFAAVDRTERDYDADSAVLSRREVLTSRQQRLIPRQQQLEDEIARQAGAELQQLSKQIAAAEKPQPRPPEYGYHSAIAPQADAIKWVQVDLGTPHEIVRAKLLACDDDFNSIGAGFGFPLGYRLEACDAPDFATDVQLLADRSDSVQPNPGRAPVELDVRIVTRRYVRLTATKLATRKKDFILALAELELLDANGQNVARGAMVTALDSIEAPVRWRRANLVDGLAPSQAGSPDQLSRLQTQRQSLLRSRVSAETLTEQRDIREQLQQIEQQLGQLPSPLKAYVGAVHHGSGNFRGTGPDGGRPRTIHVLHRGDVTRPGRVVNPGALSCLTALTARFELAANAQEGERRAALAHWITDKRNPLTWRSIVNRVWQHHFGQGIVSTPSDFGLMGEPPSHPELLDWLAVEFRDRGQSLKDLHRMIVTSRAWKQSSRIEDPQQLSAGLSVDPENRLLWRMSRRQLEAECVRDSLLLAADRLNLEMGGPSFQDFVIEKPQHSPHYQYHLHDPDDPASQRRAVYRFLVRSQTEPFMTTLDCADPSMLVDQRNETVSPLQALTLLNSSLSLTMSAHFADRLRAEQSTLPAQLAYGAELTLGRPANAEELADLTDYARQHGLKQTCRVLLNLNEALFVD
ncbi:MAG: DUF1553 domain-containing protein [Planctomycetaceae bacterium]